MEQQSESKPVAIQRRLNVDLWWRSAGLIVEYLPVTESEPAPEDKKEEK